VRCAICPSVGWRGDHDRSRRDGEDREQRDDGAGSPRPRERARLFVAIATHSVVIDRNGHDTNPSPPTAENPPSDLPRRG
jgi:hypothetical protein